LPETCREVEINILRSGMHLVGFIRKRLYRDVRSRKHKSNPIYRFVGLANLTVGFFQMFAESDTNSLEGNL